MAKADKDLVDIVAEHRFGSGDPSSTSSPLAAAPAFRTLLRGLKRHDVSITAIVTVADDGGSTGKIRSAYDIPAPGDIRNCLVALADDESLVSRLFQYRFDQAGSELDGHSFGNLFITALTKVTGSFEQAVIESANVLNIRGRVLPSTLANVRLDAELTRRHGDQRVSRRSSTRTPQSSRVRLVAGGPSRLSPGGGGDPQRRSDRARAREASTPASCPISSSPTSPARCALRPRRRFMSINVATQTGETDHFTAYDHVDVIDNQLGPGVLDAVLINSNRASADAIRPDLPIDPVLPEDSETARSPDSRHCAGRCQRSEPASPRSGEAGDGSARDRQGPWPEDRASAAPHGVMAHGNGTTKEPVIAGNHRE